MREIVLVLIVGMMPMLAVIYLATTVWIFKVQLRELIDTLEMMYKEQEALHREIQDIIIFLTKRDSRVYKRKE